MLCLLHYEYHWMHHLKHFLCHKLKATELDLKNAQNTLFFELTQFLSHSTTHRHINAGRVLLLRHRYSVTSG